MENSRSKLFIKGYDAALRHINDGINPQIMYNDSINNLDQTDYDLGWRQACIENADKIPEVKVGVIDKLEEYFNENDVDEILFNFILIVYRILIVTVLLSGSLGIIFVIFKLYNIITSL